MSEMEAVRRAYREIPHLMRQAVQGNVYLQKWCYHYILELWHREVAA